MGALRARMRLRVPMPLGTLGRWRFFCRSSFQLSFSIALQHRGVYSCGVFRRFSSRFPNSERPLSSVLFAGMGSSANVPINAFIGQGLLAAVDSITPERGGILSWHP